MSASSVGKIERYKEPTFQGKRNSKGFAFWAKRYKARAERKRARQNPECDPQYKRYHGWEF
jgi:hypothetical protein